MPVYCGPVGSGDGLDAMAAALAAGHPLALWRRCGRDHSDCREFQTRADELLARADGVDGLHRHIRALRIISMDPDATPDTVSEAAWAGSMAVLFDPPDRPPYDGVPLRVSSSSPARNMTARRDGPRTPGRFPGTGPEPGSAERDFSDNLGSPDSRTTVGTGSVPTYPRGETQ